MRNSPDPSTHRLRERQFVEHVERLLDDERLRIDTSGGRRPVTGLLRDVNRSDHGVELKRKMAEAGVPDRGIEASMPKGEVVDVLLARRKWVVLRQPVGRMRVVCVGPTEALLKGESPEPLTVAQVQKALGEIPPPLRGAPNTVVLMSTSGFVAATHEMAERRADRTLILVEPNDAGGWSVWGPAETKALGDLFDPEDDAEKRKRLEGAIDAGKGDLLTGGLGGDRLAARTGLPLAWVESELKRYAKDNAGLTAKRLDGKWVLFRQGSAPAASSGGSDMPLLDRIRSLFSGKGDNEKKIEFLSERRAALGQQREKSYEDLAALEEKDGELQSQFREAKAPLTKRRITTQLLQLRKDQERRQQIVGVLNDQINIVSTHLHNLELVRQGQSAKLPDSEELTTDAVAAEEMLARLQADNELAGSVSATTTAGGMSDEERALYEELERDGAEATAMELDPAEPPAVQRTQGERARDGRAAGERSTVERMGGEGASRTTPPERAPRRDEPEAG